MLGSATLGIRRKLGVLFFERLTIAMEGCARQLFASWLLDPNEERSISNDFHSELESLWLASHEAV